MKKFKTFITENKTEIVLISLTVAVGVAYAVVLNKAIDEQNASINETNKWIWAEAAKGRSVLELANGTLLSVDLTK